MNMHLADVLCVSGSPLKGLFFRAVGGKRLLLLPPAPVPTSPPKFPNCTFGRKSDHSASSPPSSLSESLLPGGGKGKGGEDWRLDSSWTIKIALNNLSSVKHPSWRRPRREKESLCLRRRNGPFRDVLRGLLQNSTDEDLKTA